MMKKRKMILAIVIVGAMTVLGYWLFQHPQETTTKEPEAVEAAVATVRVAPLRKDIIKQSIDAGGVGCR